MTDSSQPTSNSTPADTITPPLNLAQSGTVTPPLNLAPPGSDLGLIKDVARTPVKMYRVSDTELSHFELISTRSADAQGYCLFAAGAAISALYTLLTMPGPAPDKVDSARALLQGMLLLFVVLTGAFGRNWYRERKAAKAAMEALMKAVTGKTE